MKYIKLGTTGAEKDDDTLDLSKKTIAKILGDNLGLWDIIKIALFYKPVLLIHTSEPIPFETKNSNGWRFEFTFYCAFKPKLGGKFEVPEGKIQIIE